jgi:hypothetical protein
MRQLALQAGVSLPALNRAIKRLTYEHGLIRRDGRGEGPKSGAFVLLTGVRTTQTLSQEFLQEKEASSLGSECLTGARVPLRWGAGRLGKTNEMVLDALRHLGGEAGLAELAAATGRRARDLKRRQLSTLIERNLVVEKREGLYVLHRDFGWHLEFERALFSDEKDAEDRDRQRYREQSERFQEVWDRERSRAGSLDRGPR